MARPVSTQKASYQPALNRELSFSSSSDMEEAIGLPAMSSGGIPYNNNDDDNRQEQQGKQQQQQQQTPKRTKSLVRPERERIDKTHRQYHYRQAANKQDPDKVAPSTTGHLPARSVERQATTTDHRGLGGGDASTTLIGTSTDVTGADSTGLLLRRGKSILGREEKQTWEEDEASDTVDPDKDNKRKWPSPWYAYCLLITLCIPKPMLRCAGNKIESILGSLHK